MSANAGARGAGTPFYDLPGYQPIRELLADPRVTEIMINGPSRVFVERDGRMTSAGVAFDSPQHLNHLIETIVRPTGRTVDAMTPYVDCRLPDGSRVNIILPPLSVEGAAVTIRKFTRSLKTIDDLVKRQTLSGPMARFLCAAVKARLNIVFAGATGTGKTTTLGLLGLEISDSERIIVIEDTAELELSQPNVVRLESRRPNVEGTGEVTLEDLLVNSFRMRPTRIVMGEIRGSEAVAMLQAISSGHEGCLAVLHASSPTDAVTRLEMMTLMRGLRLPLWAVHRQISEALDLILQHEILSDGTRRITHVTEVCGVEDDRVQLQDLYTFQNDGPDETGRVQGRFLYSGAKPGFLDRFRRAGVKVPSDLDEGS